MTTTQSKRTARLVTYLGVWALSAPLTAMVVLSGIVGTYDGTAKGVTVTQTLPCAEEDSAGPCYWNASTMGNGAGMSFTVDAQQVVHYDTSGPEWVAVSQELGDTLAEGEDATATPRAWESCKVHEGVVTTVACSDGFVGRI